MNFQMNSQTSDNIRNYPLSENRTSYNNNMNIGYPTIYNNQQIQNRYDSGANIPIIKSFNKKFQIIDDKIVEIKENNNNGTENKDENLTGTNRIKGYCKRNKLVIGIIIAVLIILLIVIIGI